MTLLPGLGAIVYKELRQARRDPATIFLALLIPVIQLTIFGYAIDTEVRDIRTVVVDRARASRAFEDLVVRAFGLRHLETSEGFVLYSTDAPISGGD